MIPRLGFGAPVAVALLALALTGCMPGGATPAPSGPPTATSSPSAPAGGDEARFLITCFYPDGSEVATFTRLEEAWASTNYVRIDHCEATVGAPDGFELSDEEAAVAEVAAAGLPDDDSTELYLQTLAACVRIPPDGDHGMSTYPDSVLEAALVLCPEAPHAGLIEEELATGSSG